MTTATDRIRIQTSVCFLIVLVGLLCAGRTRMMRDPGTLWHTVVGAQMLEEHCIMREDAFSFTHKGDDWLAQQWLAEVGMAFIHRIAGLDGLLLCACSILAGIFAFLYARSARARLPVFPAIIFLLVIAAAGSYHFIPRPHLATLLFMTLGTAVFCDIESGSKARHRLLMIPPIMVLWTNLHGGALAGLASLVLIAVGLLMRPGFLPRPQSFSSPWPLLLAFTVGLSIVSILVNPFGPSLPRVWLSLMNSTVLPKVIIEHAATDLLTAQGAIILTIGGVYLAFFAMTSRTTFKVTWLLPAVWFILALSRIRHAPIFALVAAVVILDMIPHSPWAAKLAQLLNSKGPVTNAMHSPAGENWLRRLMTRPAIFMLSVTILALAIQAGRIPLPIIGANWCKLDPAYWPIEATAELNKRITANPNANRVFNDMRYGGYLMYSAPTARIYIDDRCELYRDAGLLRYVELLKHPDRIEGESVYENIDFALVRSDSTHAKHLSHSANWSALHRDRTAMLFVRNASTAAVANQ